MDNGIGPIPFRTATTSPTLISFDGSSLSRSLTPGPNLYQFRPRLFGLRVIPASPMTSNPLPSLAINSSSPAPAALRFVPFRWRQLYLYQPQHPQLARRRCCLVESCRRRRRITPSYIPPADGRPIGPSKPSPPASAAIELPGRRLWQQPFFVTVGDAGYLATSTGNGVNWTKHTAVASGDLTFVKLDQYAQ